MPAQRESTGRVAPVMPCADVCQLQSQLHLIIMPAAAGASSSSYIIGPPACHTFCCVVSPMARRRPWQSPAPRSGATTCSRVSQVWGRLPVHLHNPVQGKQAGSGVPVSRGASG